MTRKLLNQQQHTATQCCWNEWFGFSVNPPGGTCIPLFCFFERPGERQRYSRGVKKRNKIAQGLSQSLCVPLRVFIKETSVLPGDGMMCSNIDRPIRQGHHGGKPPDRNERYLVPGYFSPTSARSFRKICLTIPRCLFSQIIRFVLYETES